VIGVVCFAIIVVSWFGGVRWFKGVPAASSPSRRLCRSLGRDGSGPGLRRHESRKAERRRIELRLFGAAAGDRPCLLGFEFLGVILVTAIPFGIYDLVEAMDNVESAALPATAFPTRVLTPTAWSA
jgi:AGZA family xanthine/uracil permease-like MFS transporter